MMEDKIILSGCASQEAVQSNAADHRCLTRNQQQVNKNNERLAPEPGRWQNMCKDRSPTWTMTAHRHSNRRLS
jgi:hypothetical protein